MKVYVFTRRELRRLRAILRRLDRWRMEPQGEESEDHFDLIVDTSDELARVLHRSDRARGYRESLEQSLAAQVMELHNGAHEDEEPKQ